jgi:predicted amidohydrolase YtcJ
MSDRATAVVGAKVLPMIAGGAVEEAVAWRAGCLIAIGSEAAVRRVAGPDAAVWDAGGCSVLPGFIDAHQHPGIACLYNGGPRLAPPAVTDIQSLQRALRARDQELPPGQWLVANHWDEMLLAERRAPTRQEIDEAVPDRPVFAMHYSCHRALVNSQGLELAGIGRGTPDPSGGAISRGARGEPDGVLIERGMSRAESLARASQVLHDVDGFVARLDAHYRGLTRAGITRIADAAIPVDLIELYREAARRGVVRVPTVLMPTSATGYLEAPVDVIDALPKVDAAGPLRIGPVKLVFDGAPVCAMCLSARQLLGVSLGAALLSLRTRSLDPVRATLSVSPRFGWRTRTGINIYRRDEARDVVARAVSRGIPLATHAVGNDAVDVALSAYEAAGRALLEPGVPRLEHAAFLSPELVSRIAAQGAAVVTQPHFVTLPAFASAPRIPGIASLPTRSLLDAGVLVAGSSDHPVADFEPLAAVRSAVERKTARGHVFEPEQRIELLEALALYTRSAAQVLGALDETGTLEVGKRADVVVLDGPLESAADLARVSVRGTVVGGELAWGTLGQAS